MIIGKQPHHGEKYLNNMGVNMKSNRIVSLTLASLLALLCSCGGTASDSNVTSAANNDDSSTVSEESNWYDSLGDRDFKKRTITVLSRDETANWVQSFLEMGSCEQNGETLNDAIIKRNRLVEEKYNLTLEITNDYNAANILKSSVLSGEQIADIVILSLASLSQLNDQGLLYDLTQSSYLDFSQPWWDQNAAGDLALKNHLTFMVGDLTPMTGQGTWLMYFNKDLIEKYNLDDPYELVDNNLWTGDTMFGMAKKVSSDLNGDAAFDELDQYGLLVQNDDVQMIYQAFGERYTENDADFDDISFVREALDAASYETVKPAYYETTLGAKLMRDERSYEMFDIVMKSRSFDVMCLYNWGNIVSSLNLAGSGGTGSFMSTIASKRTSIEEGISSTIDAMAD